MHRKLTTVAILTGAVLLGCLVLMGASALSEPNQVKVQPKPTDLKSIPLTDHLIALPSPWATAYSEQPIEKVMYVYNFAAIIAKVNAQQKEIVDLRNRMEALEAMSPKDIAKPTQDLKK